MFAGGTRVSAVANEISAIGEQNTTNPGPRTSSSSKGQYSRYLLTVGTLIFGVSLAKVFFCLNRHN